MALKCLTTKYRRRRQKERVNRAERQQRIAAWETLFRRKQEAVALDKMAAYLANRKVQEIQKLAHLLHVWLNNNPFYRFNKTRQTRQKLGRHWSDFRLVTAWWCPLCKLPITVVDLSSRNVVYQTVNHRRIQLHRICPTDDTHGFPPGYVWLKEGSPGSHRYA